jgi:hypothetical protein
MDVVKLSDYTGGWFIGDFAPTMAANPDFEVCLKRYSAGDTEPIHYQFECTEYTVVVAGRCRIGDYELGPDDILRIHPMEAAGFEALTDVVLVAVKTPSKPFDKVVGSPA